MSFGDLGSRTWRVVLATALVCLLAPFHSGCSAFARIPTPEPVTIAFSCSERDQEFFERIVLNFSEQYPHITVELRPRGQQNQGRPHQDGRGRSTGPRANSIHRGDLLFSSRP